MRVLLLNPNFTIKVESRDDFSFFPPLGLAIMAALLEKAGHEVEVIDLNLKLVRGQVAEAPESPGFLRYGYSDAETKALIEERAPDLVGVSSIFTPFYRDALRVCNLVKEVNPKIHTVMGGAHSSMESAKVIPEPAVDFVIRGEGEQPFAALVAKLAEGASWENIKGIVGKENGVVRDGGMGEQIKTLDDLPYPAYHKLNMGFYSSRKDKNFAFSMRFPIGHMITSRGCPYVCVFCSTRNFFPNYRAHSAERVIEEIEFLIRDYGVREIHFHDDAFLIIRKRVEKICNLMIEKKLNIKWQISQGVNLNLVDEELLALMHKSGMYRMGLPIESGSEEILELIRKKANLNHARKVITAANRLGIFTHANFIIGFPFETEKQMAETHAFAAKCGVDFLKMLLCQPLAGAELYEVYRREGLLDEIRHSSTYTSTEYGTSHFSAEQLNERRKQILRDFHRETFKRVISPRRFRSSIWPKVKTFESAAYVLRLSVRLAIGRMRR
ncbi:MAG: B12-binding domain-containing radical SAM protein [Bdellovibrionota bacterium]